MLHFRVGVFSSLIGRDASPTPTRISRELEPRLAVCQEMRREHRKSVVIVSYVRRRRPLKSLTWRSKAPFSVFSLSLHHRFPSRSQSRVLRPRKQICRLQRRPTRLQKSKLKRRRNRRKQRLEVLHQRTTPNLRNWDSTSRSVTRHQKPNKSKSSMVTVGPVCFQELRFNGVATVNFVVLIAHGCFLVCNLMAEMSGIFLVALQHKQRGQRYVSAALLVSIIVDMACQIVTFTGLHFPHGQDSFKISYTTDQIELQRNGQILGIFSVSPS